MEKNRKIPIYFSSRNQPYSSLNGKSITLSPAPETWNDFTLKTRFYCTLYEDGAIAFKTKLLLGFIETKESPVDLVRNALEKSSGEPIQESTLPKFFTMQQSLEDYRRCIRELGESEGVGLLVNISDIVEASRKTKPPAWLTAAQKTRAFIYSFMRQSESHFAFHNASPILSGLNNEIIGGISHNFSINFKLASFKNRHDVRFSFLADPLIPSRFSVIIGKNGTGKSRTLYNLTKAALHDGPTLKDADGNRPRFNRLIAIESPGETTHTFPRLSKLDRRKLSIDYRQITLSGGIRKKMGRGNNNLLIKLLRSHESIGEKSRWDIFLNSIHKIISAHKLVLHLSQKKTGSPNNTSWLPLSSIKSLTEERLLDTCSRAGPEVRRLTEKDQIVPLSSGQLTFLRFTAELCLNVDNGSLVLIDEPETHLHPDLITEFAALLNNVLSLTGSLAIIATHSSYFVREAPGNNVLILKETPDGEIEITSPRLKTFGADVGAISQYVFGDPLRSKILENLKLKLIKNPAEYSATIKALKEHLPTEALMFLDPSNPVDLK